jgi:zinc/manganese transport system substrate-binding protein
MVLSRTWRPAIVPAAFAALGLVACGGDDDGAADATGPVVVATTGIWADVAGMVACDGAVTVEALVPPGGDPHGYEPSLRDRERLDAAALIVANGGGLEALLDDTLEQVEGGGVPVVRMVDLAGGDDGDRHVWFDPAAVSAALPALGDALVDAGAGRAAIDRCVGAAQTELRELDADVAAALAVVPAERRVLVTNHDSLGAFADRYGFEVLGSVLPSTSTLGEASPSALESLEEEIEATGVPAIFAEKLHATADADALGDRLGVEVVELYTDALGEPGSGADTYPGLLRTDAARIAAALGA